MPARLSKIDELTRPDHTFLEPGDHCYYLGDYTSRRGFAFSEINKLIHNLRKPMNRRALPEWRYREAAIVTCGAMLRGAMDKEWLSAVTLVPIPSSKTQEDPEYDDRLPRILQELSIGSQLDIRELIVMTRSVHQSHLAEERVSIEELIASMSLAEACLHPAPRIIGIVDDVLTTGRHFKAAQTVVRQRFPAVPVVGIFIARRAPDSMLP